MSEEMKRCRLCECDIFKRGSVYVYCYDFCSKKCFDQWNNIQTKKDLDRMKENKEKSLLDEAIERNCRKAALVFDSIKRLSDIFKGSPMSATCAGMIYKQLQLATDNARACMSAAMWVHQIRRSQSIEWIPSQCEPKLVRYDKPIPFSLWIGSCYRSKRSAEYPAAGMLARFAHCKAKGWGEIVPIHNDIVYIKLRIPSKSRHW